MACTPGGGDRPKDDVRQRPAADGGADGGADQSADGGVEAPPIAESPETETTDPAPELAPTEPLDAEGCTEAIALYLERRAALNHCEVDSDCAEMWPGVCPHGSYYIDRAADVSTLYALVDQIEGSCELPECEPPIWLGPGRCEDGVCVDGRTPPDDTCWDIRVEYLESGGGFSTETVAGIRGSTPLHAIGAPAAGTLSLTVGWGDCSDCELRISEHNSGMANLVQGTRERVGERETIELPVTPGPYYLLGYSPTGPHRLTVSIEMLDSAGQRREADLHGVAWQRVCED